MKINKYKYFTITGLAIFLIGCSTKKDKFINRNFQALNTEFNVLYSGNVALDAGVNEVKNSYKDNFWDILPIERMQILEEDILPGQSKNANFEKAEEKAVKAIQKRSMLIDNQEKNAQIDEAYLLLGKARYYDQRFLPAQDAFNYILYKNANSDKIYEAKIWREKTNLRLENEGLAVKNLTKLLKDIKFKDQIFADANATLTQAFLNLNQLDSAIFKLKLAKNFTKLPEEKARYSFILGQLYNSLNYKDSAFITYQKVINMKRNAPKQYVIQSHVKQAEQFNFKTDDTLLFVEKFNKLIENRENKPYLSVLYHQKALFYDKQNNQKQAVFNYNKSLKSPTEDRYLGASNYRNLAEIYFKKAKYQTAGTYFDSTMVMLKPRSRELIAIKKKRDNLDDVIKYETIAHVNDSILNILALSTNDRIDFYQKHIDKLKEADIAKAKELEVQNQEKKQSQNQDANLTIQNPASIGNPNESLNNFGNSNFYFYNAPTVALGKKEFLKRWGNRDASKNWRISKETINNTTEILADNSLEQNSEVKKPEGIDLNNPKYLAEFYIDKLPTNKIEIDSISRERNFAYYQLGIIYKEKFKEYQLAANRLEFLLKNNPEERLVLSTMYHLYKVYLEIDKSNAANLKNRIIKEFPESRYAQLLLNPGLESESDISNPEVFYASLYKELQDGNFRNVLPKIEKAVIDFNGEEINPKLELLRATLYGKLKGLSEYKKQLNYVALNYANVKEGKEAEALLLDNIPYLESLYFDQAVPLSYKIIYRANNLEDKNTKDLIEKTKKFIVDKNHKALSTSIDIYTLEDNFFVIHGISNLDYAKGIVSILKDFKEYLIKDQAIIITNENYKVVQIKKNLNEYLDPTLRVEPPKYSPRPKIAGQEKTVPNIQLVTPPSGKQNDLKGKQEIKNNSQEAMMNNDLNAPPSLTNKKKG